MAERTVFLSKLIGLYCILYALAMIINKPTIVAGVNTLVHTPSELLILSVILLPAGIALVLGHNVWSGGALPIVVTLVGWGTLFKGLVIVLLPPEGVAAYMAGLHYETMFYFYAAITLALGAYLTYAGYRAR